MKKLLITTAIAGLALAVPAFAQDDQHDQQGKHHEQGNPQAGGGQKTPGGGMQGAPMQGGGMQGEHRSWQGGGMQGTPTQGSGMQGEHRSWQGGGMQGQSVGAMHGSTIGMGSGQRPSGWQGYEHNQRTGGQTLDLRQLHRNVTSQHRYHIGGYHRPQGYFDRHWQYGQTLPRGFWVRTYWIDDFWLYGLLAPPPGCVWVRVGDDALLVDEDTGEIVEVVYDIFY